MTCTEFRTYMTRPGDLTSTTRAERLASRVHYHECFACQALVLFAPARPGTMSEGEIQRILDADVSDPEAPEGEK